jgi:sugar O-acyltransferase (sialic acid O-acetyltransferase NeuD family)
MKKVWIVGAGGFSKVFYEILQTEKNIKILGFLDDDDSKRDKKAYGIPILTPINKIKKIIKNTENNYFTISIGNTKIRHNLYLELRNYGMLPINIIDKHAIISPLATIEEGVMIESGTCINASAIIKENCCICLNVSIGHDAKIGRSVHLSHNVSLGGGAILEDCVFMGLNSCVLPNIKVGKNSIIGAGAVVTKDIPPDVIAVGTPAKVIKKRK